MGLLVAFGFMNVAAMLTLAGVVVIEKAWVHGRAITRVVGIGTLALAVLVVWVPALAPGLQARPMGGM